MVSPKRWCDAWLHLRTLLKWRDYRHREHSNGCQEGRVCAYPGTTGELSVGTEMCVSAAAATPIWCYLRRRWYPPVDTQWWSLRRVLCDVTTGGIRELAQESSVFFLKPLCGSIIISKSTALKEIKEEETISNTDYKSTTDSPNLEEAPQGGLQAGNGAEGRRTR